MFDINKLVYESILNETDADAIISAVDGDKPAEIEVTKIKAKDEESAKDLLKKLGKKVKSDIEESPEAKGFLKGAGALGAGVGALTLAKHLRSRRRAEMGG